MSSSIKIIEYKPNVIGKMFNLFRINNDLGSRSQAEAGSPGPEPFRWRSGGGRRTAAAEAAASGPGSPQKGHRPLLMDQILN